MRFGLKRKKENEFSFYAPHPNQLLSEVLFTTAGLFLKNFANLRVLGGSALKYTALGSVCLVCFVVKIYRPGYLETLNPKL